MIQFNTIKVISGGQTGADLGGLIAARMLGLETGGIAPKNFTTSVGNNPLILIDGEELKLLDFGLVPRGSYSARTYENVKNADVTVILAYNKKSPGTLLTIKYCQELNRPYVVINPLEENASFELLTFFSMNSFLVLNVAGNREYRGQEREAVFTTLCAKLIYFSLSRYFYATNSLKGF